MPARVALATASTYPLLAPDDQVLCAELVRRGVAAEPVIWDSQADWSRYDAVVVRSIWDYHLKYARFTDWLDTLDAAGVRVHNPTALLRHNADKHYLLELERNGIRVTPTRAVARGEPCALAGLLAETGWQHAVIKPVVSSTGYETWFANAPCSSTDGRRFADQLGRMDVLVQEFVPGVHAGEMSFVFIAGEYTHAILKRAAAAEFRVHIEHGGTVEPFAPDAAGIDWAASVVSAVAGSWTYARVDAVAGNQGLMLMELELLDPELFFQYSAAATDRFINAIAAA